MPLNDGVNMPLKYMRIRFVSIKFMCCQGRTWQKVSLRYTLYEKALKGKTRSQYSGPLCWTSTNKVTLYFICYIFKILSVCRNLSFPFSWKLWVSRSFIPWSMKNQGQLWCSSLRHCYSLQDTICLWHFTRGCFLECALLLDVPSEFWVGVYCRRGVGGNMDSLYRCGTAGCKE